MILTLSLILRTSIVNLCLGHVAPTLSIYLLYLRVLTVQELQRPGQGIVAFSPHPSGHGRSAQGVHFVREDAHEVRKASDVKDLDVVVAQAVRHKAVLRGACLRKQVPNQDDSSRVDVVYPLEVEEDGPRVLGLCLSVGGVEGFLGEVVDLAAKVKDGATPLPAHTCLEVFSRHRPLRSSV